MNQKRSTPYYKYNQHPLTKPEAVEEAEVKKSVLEEIKEEPEEQLESIQSERDLQLKKVCRFKPGEIAEVNMNQKGNWVKAYVIRIKEPFIWL